MTRPTSDEDRLGARPLCQIVRVQLRRGHLRRPGPAAPAGRASGAAPRPPPGAGERLRGRPGRESAIASQSPRFTGPRACGTDQLEHGAAAKDVEIGGVGMARLGERARPRCPGRPSGRPGAPARARRTRRRARSPLEVECTRACQHRDRHEADDGDEEPPPGEEASVNRAGQASPAASHEQRQANHRDPALDATSTLGDFSTEPQPAFVGRARVIVDDGNTSGMARLAR